MLSQDHLEHVELDSPLDVDVFCFSRTQSLRGKGVILNARYTTLDPSKLRIVAHVKSLRTIDNVGEIEVDNVVASYNIWIDFKQKISPSLQQLLLTAEGVHLRSDNRCTSSESEYISNKGLSVSMDLNDISNLDNWITLGLREPAFIGGTFNVETEDPKRSDL